MEWCVVGALSRPLPYYAYMVPLGVEAMRLLVEANNLSRKGEIVALTGIFYETEVSLRTALERWNDHENRTKEEVLEAFDRAISLGLREAGDR